MTHSVAISENLDTPKAEVHIKCSSFVCQVTNSVVYTTSPAVPHIMLPAQSSSGVASSNQAVNTPESSHFLNLAIMSALQC